MPVWIFAIIRIKNNSAPRAYQAWLTIAYLATTFEHFHIGFLFLFFLPMLILLHLDNENCPMHFLGESPLT